MLQEMRVRGLGRLDDVEVSFATGLNVLTGETGAGKTLLVTSLSLLCGARADARLVAHGAREALVEAVLTPTAPVRELLAGRGIEVDDELTVVRRIGSDGRSRAWLGGQLVPASILTEAGRLLVEIHGQRDSFGLAQTAAQLEALDAFAGAAPLLERYRGALSDLRELDHEREMIAEQARERARTADALGFQIAEIERARLDPSEDDGLAGELSRLEHADRLAELGSSALQSLAGAEVGSAAKSVREAARIDAAAGELADRLEALATDATDIAAGLRAWRDSIDSDPARLGAVQDRVAAVARLKGRYGDSVREVLAYADECRARLADLEGADDRAAQLDGRRPVVVEELDGAAADLSRTRADGAGRLETLVRSELPALALPSARFDVSCETGPDSESGRDRVEMRFAPSAEGPAAPLGRGPSGGELSRVMIAITLALASAHAVPVVVLDEADQGLGGQAALELARRVRLLGRTHQVLVVTHLPQLAAYADHHLAVEQGAVRQLDGAARVAEVSRMLSGLGESARAQAHAAELLEMAAGEHAASPTRRTRARVG